MEFKSIETLRLMYYLKYNKHLDYKEQGKYLIDNYTGEQRTEEWFNTRKKYIGGSELGQYTNTGKTFKHKILQRLNINPYNPGQIDSYAIRHGISMEYVATEFFKKKFDCKIHELTFVPNTLLTLPDSDTEFLGASPDGLIEFKDGTFAILEIKCPQRDIKAKVHSAYQYQIQQEMMSTCIPELYYFEFSIKETSKEKLFDGNGVNVPLGFVLVNEEELFDFDTETTSYSYTYSEIFEDTFDIDEESKKIKTPSGSIKYYYINDYEICHEYKFCLNP
jgi:hypothetical protein